MIEFAIAFVGIKILVAAGVISTVAEVDKEVEAEKERLAEDAFKEGVEEGATQAEVNHWEEEVMPPWMKLLKKKHQLEYLEGYAEEIRKELEDEGEA